jgi:hypothetical protein
MKGTSLLYSPIKDLIREWADHRCQRCGHPYHSGEHGNGEWSPCDEHCTHGGPMRYHNPIAPPRPISDANAKRMREMEPEGARRGYFEAAWRILTVHHLDEDKANCRWWNLVALCQRCHLRMQRAVVMDRPYLFEHSEWFKPYAAGFYAHKYLGDVLSREQTMNRLPELLALEHRFMQEAIF